MHKKYILLFIFLGIFFTDCITHKRSAYVYPDGIPETEKEKLFVIYEKGRKLYELYCSKCHGVYEKGKDNMPNFSVRQTTSYTTRYLKGDPKNHAVAANMDPEQLNAVFMFLRYRKINGQPAALLPEKKDIITHQH